RVMHEAGVVEYKAEANRRIYKLRPEPFKELNSWLEQYRELWEERVETWIVICEIYKKVETKRMITKIYGGIKMLTQVEISHTSMLHVNWCLRHLPNQNIYRIGGGQKVGRLMFLNQISARVVSFITARNLLMVM